MKHLLVLVPLLFLIPSQASAQTDTAKLAAQARAILEANCYKCHGKDGSREGGVGYILDAERLRSGKRPKVVAGKPDQSSAFVRMSSTDEFEAMPPSDEAVRPSKEDIAVIKRWIAAGAPDFPEVTEQVARKRQPVILLDAYQSMLKHLRDAEDTNSAKYQRFFTLYHLHNNPDISDDQMALYRAGLAKALNSLSWRKALVLPRPIDPQGTILALDVRDLDWDLNFNWDKIISASRKKGGFGGYPYALTHDRLPVDQQLNSTAVQVYTLARSKMPAVRADWFIANAVQPPLYHELLNLPDNVDALEQQLKVNVRANYLRETMARAGFVQSGVSGQNRLVERHHGLFGCYWKSYDFKSNVGEGNLLKLPLGPLNLFEHGHHPYANQSFVHDGGEMIFALPNGLHAYFLTDGKGSRIDTGPETVVRDRNDFAGRGPTIVNGISCFGCHKHGMIEFTDEIRDRSSLQGDPLAKVRRLYPDAKRMNRLVGNDQDHYLDAFEDVVGQYLKVGTNRDKDIKLFQEPITAIATPYLRGNLTIRDAGFELGMNAEKLATIIQNNGKLRDELGLKVLAQDGVLKRELWESIRDTYSPYQLAAEELQLGSPLLIRRFAEN